MAALTVRHNGAPILEIKHNSHRTRKNMMTRMIQRMKLPVRQVTTQITLLIQMKTCKTLCMLTVKLFKRAFKGCLEAVVLAMWYRSTSTSGPRNKTYVIRAEQEATPDIEIKKEETPTEKDTREVTVKML
jgi:hypothetical protein